MDDVKKAKTAKVLIVDDEEGIRITACRHLEKEGFRVFTAENGVLALELFSRERPDVVVADLRLPELDGAGILFAVKKISPLTPVIIISGFAEKEDLMRLFRLGVSDYIEKPIKELAVLGESIRINLEKSREIAQGQIDQKRLEEDVDKRTFELRQRLSDIEVLNEALRRGLAERERLIREQQKMRDGVINSIVTIGEKRDPYTAGHQQRVAHLATALAGELGIAPDQIEGIRIAGLLHDIGKISIPAEILNRPGPLKESEMNLIKDHPTDGYNILKGINFPWPVAEIVYQHHERIDGSGYPRGLRLNEILIEARILALADVVEAIASRRPYRESLGTDKALEEISKATGIHYDADIANACIGLFKEKGFTLE
jgi:putative two-component system response regulator